MTRQHSEMNTKSLFSGRKIAVSGPFPPPPGGMPVITALLAQKLHDDGAAIYKLNSNPAIGFWERLRFVRGIIKFVIFFFHCLCRIPQVEAIHIISNSYLNFYLFTLPPFLIGKIFGKRIIINFHGGAADEFLLSQGCLIRHFFSWADIVMVQTGFLAGIFARHQIKTIIVPNVVPLDRFQFKLRQKLSPKLISTRNLEPIYNIACAIRALQIIRKQVPSASLTVVGGGTEKEKLSALAVNLGVEEAVHFTGSIPNTSLPNYFLDHDIFVNTSNIDNMPISILEAFASGLPVVTTNSGGIPFIVKDRVTGLLVEKNDHEHLAESVLTMLQDQKLARSIIQNSHQYVKQFSWENVRNQLADVYFSTENSLSSEKTAVIEKD